MSLTEIKVRQAHCKEKTCFLSDEDGLSLKIEPTGRKSWCYRYTDPQTKKRRRIQLGLYPDLSLKKARQVKDDFKDNNYCFEHDTVSNVITFRKVGEEWLQFKLKNAFNDSPRCGVLQLAERCLQQDIYPDLQDLPFQNIKRYDLVSVIKKIEGRQVKEPVKKACSYLNQIYDYAVAMGYCEYNIAHGLNKIVINSKIKKNYPYLKAEEISEFKNKWFGSIAIIERYCRKINFSNDLSYSFLIVLKNSQDPYELEIISRKLKGMVRHQIKVVNTKNLDKSLLIKIN